MFQVCAEDVPSNSYEPRLSGCKEVPVEVTNVDDTCPVFQPYPTLTVQENSASVQTVWASISTVDFDDDDGTNSAQVTTPTYASTILSHSQTLKT